MIAGVYVAMLTRNPSEIDRWLKFTKRVIAEIELMNPPRKKVGSALAQIEVMELERMYREAE